MNESSTIIWQEGDWFIAQSLDLEIASQGRRSKKPWRISTEALELFLEPSVMA
jgi:hypothetical protein